jgi:3-methyl-2-oxobutanoate hydroxymethyltransferase
MPVTTQKLIESKRQRKPIVVLTAWDYAIASILDEAGVDAILIGDSLAMVALGYSTTLPVTLDAMIHHAAAVQRGVKQALTIADLPFLSYQESTAQAMRSAGRFLKEAGVNAVKLEGGHPFAVETVAQLTMAGIPVMGHVGLTPQSVRRLGYRQQGKTQEDRDRILREAIALAEAGAFAIVLEHIPADLAATITDKLEIPTIGIGAGLDCDGQVLVTADFLGLSDQKPPFAKAYANLRQIITSAAQNYAEDVRQRRFPEITN